MKPRPLRLADLLSPRALVAIALVAAAGCAAEPAQMIPSTPIGPPILSLRGVSLSGAEFGGSAIPGTYGGDYTYPTHEEVDYFVAKGMTILRIPFLWERLQPALGGDFDATELGRLDDIVDYAVAAGTNVLIDPHNYASYDGNVIGYGSVTAAAFADFWSKLAEHFKALPQVYFGLMNEPHSATSQTLKTEDWVAAANGAIQAIRATGATNTITVSGNGYDTASGWNDNWYGSSNGGQLLKITDPLDKVVFEAHQYMDSDGSGTSPTCVSTTIGSTRLAAFTGWLRVNKKRGFLGEFGAGTGDTCLAAIDDMLSFIDSYSDVYLGWTWWAAGPWWGNYFSSIEPGTGGTDKPQMSVLANHLR